MVPVKLEWDNMQDMHQIGKANPYIPLLVFSSSMRSYSWTLSFWTWHCHLLSGTSISKCLMWIFPWFLNLVLTLQNRLYKIILTVSSHLEPFTCLCPIIHRVGVSVCILFNTFKLLSNKLLMWFSSLIFIFFSPNSEHYTSDFPTSSVLDLNI